MRGDREQFLQAGFDGYLSKPLAIKESLAELKRVTWNDTVTKISV